jgi:uncharacterized protein
MNVSFALITGATSGIGKKLTELLAEKGFSLLLIGRNQEELSLLKKQFPQESIEIHRADLLQPEGRSVVVTLIRERVPDLVINCAGLGLYGDALSYSTEEQLAILEVNINALVEITLQAARTLFFKKKKGIILNVSSAAGFDFYPGMAVYAASKAFVTSFSEAFDFEMQKSGIRILTSCPGMVETNFQFRAGEVQQNNPVKMMNSNYVAKEIWEQIQSLQSVKIIDWRYRMINIFSYLIPKQWLAAAKKAVIEKRIQKRPYKEE